MSNETSPKPPSDKQLCSTSTKKLCTEELLHELQVNQEELETQNRQLVEAQIELEAARDQYADLYDFAPLGYLTLDAHGVVQKINLTGVAMLGQERLSIVGKPFVNHLVTASYQTFLSHLRHVFMFPGNNVTELQIKGKDKKIHTINLESLASSVEKSTCRVMMTDVTEHRRMAIALQVSNAAQDALLKAIPALLYFMDAQLRFLNVSQVFADFVGHTPEDLVGKSLQEVFTPAVADDLNKIASSVLKTGSAVYGFENSLSDASGTVCYMSTVLAAFRDINGDALGIVGVSLDVSGFKQSERDNRELLNQNRKLTRGLFAAQEEERRRIAVELHDELGQWFTAIQAESQVICNIAKDTPKIHDSALAISKSASAVHAVIRGMLRKLRPSLLDELGLADSLRELERQWCHIHPQVICELNIEIPLDNLGEELNLTIYRLMQESLSNIASHANAKKVVISLSQEVSERTGRHILVLKVEDDGSGFETNNVRAGIGLVGMRERVIAVGGEFLLESVPGVGTSLMAKLPLLESV